MNEFDDILRAKALIKEINIELEIFKLDGKILNIPLYLIEYIQKFIWNWLSPKVQKSTFGFNISKK